DILEYRPGVSRRLPVSSHSILAPTWPARLSEAGRTTLLVNVPLTYPAPASRVERALGLPGARDGGRRHRRRRDPAGPPLQPSARGRPAPGLADQRGILDDVPPQAARA